MWSLTEACPLNDQETIRKRSRPVLWTSKQENAATVKSNMGRHDSRVPTIGLLPKQHALFLPLLG